MGTEPTRAVAPVPAGRSRRRSLGTTAGLAAVLLSLGAFVTWGNLTTTRAARTQAEALAVAGLFDQAQYSVSVQELYARQYQLQPSSAAHRRYREATESTVQALHAAERTGDPDARERSRELLALEQEYQGAADHMVLAVANGDAGAALIDSAQVAPAYFSLQERVNDIARVYRVAAQHRVTELLRLQQRMLVGTIAGFAAGLGLLGMIWRLVLGYQHNLARHADVNAHLALHDPLTGLPNRAFFAQRLAEALEAGEALAIMILDLDRFKEVNDTLGHHAGDQLLVEVGRRLRQVLRPQDVVARLGGDEFAILLTEATDLDVARTAAERAAVVLREPFRLDGAAAPVAVPASIGVAVWAGQGSVDDLVQQADAAMYRAKSGHLGVAVYDELLDLEDPARVALSGHLRLLLETGAPQGELVLVYQPQVRLADGEIHGVEALARWHHPTLGLLSPGEFLPIAEQTGLEAALTYHLLALAVQEAAGWARTGRPLPVAVNVSPPCLLEPGFADTVCATVSRAGLAPTLVRIEVTEGSVMADPSRSREVLEILRDAGIGASVADFGSGFSSLGQLRRMPVQELKIDKSFVHDVAHDGDDAVLVRTAIDLGHHHGTVVVAEGVEDDDALATLYELGCDVVQGFLLSLPVPPEAVFEACERASATVRTLLAPRDRGLPRPRTSLR